MTLMLPDSVPAGTTSSEIEIFQLIRDLRKSEHCICLHSLGIARHRRKSYAEADFVFIGPAGIYCLEVKGGEVNRHSGVWNIGWPGKSYTSQEGPFRQAEGTRWALLDYLTRQLGETFRRDAVLGWGVVFPDIVFEQSDPEWDQVVVFDQRDKAGPFVRYVDRLERYFRERLSETGRPQPPTLGPARVREIARSLRGDFDVVTSLNGLLYESDRELVALSSEQYRILDFALNDANPRILCDGGAGTGKTLVAIEAGRRLARSGLSALLLCFNENLRHFLRLEVSQSSEKIDIRTVYSLFGDIIRRGGFAEELSELHKTVAAAKLFGDVYPKLFETACAVLFEEAELPQYDVIIIDEAQDILHSSVMNCLDLVLAGGFSRGRWLIFHDLGLQAELYGRMNPKVMAHLQTFHPVNFILRENFRNPKSIVAEMCVVTGVQMPPCRRELVSPVDYRVFDDERDQAKKLRALLVELLREGIAAERVTILCGCNIEASCVSRYPPDIGKAFQIVGRELGIQSRDAFSVSTVAGFKGLENDIVVLTDISDSSNHEWFKSVLYVGMTRARTKLFVLIKQAFLDARFSARSI